MATTEHTINDVLAAILRTTRSAWRDSDIVRSENTGMLRGTNERPDILILEPNVSPVVIETEVQPAATVEAEAVSRLGKHLRATGRTILSSIAVRLPVSLRSKQGKNLQNELAASQALEMVLFTGADPLTASRWPRSGWMRGNVADLSILAQSASVPPEIIDQAANELVAGVSEAAGMLAEMVKKNPGAIHQISESLYQEDGTQTRRMAATILANAFIFQETLAGGPKELANVKSVEQLRGAGQLRKSSVLTEWRRILKVNYWPIFDIARRILEVIPTAESKPLIEELADTADKLLENQLMRSHDLTGAVFQRLIIDRKFLAAFYTTPASAALLAGLAITPTVTPAGESWSSSDHVSSLRIADFACGTGTLLSTTYQRIGQLHELAGGNAEELHPAMMSSALIGCDVLPAAAHLTASMLSGAHPTTKYEQSSILTVAYGKQPEGHVLLGSLDLLDPQGKFEPLAVTARAAEAMGESERETWRSLPHSSFDLVIMNPPFTRATGHEGEKIGIPNPMFAAFSSTDEEQRLMGAATKRLTEGSSAHGNAGEASIFLVLADRMMKRDGVLALVMPLSLMLGDAWEDSRTLLVKGYSDLVLVSIAGADGADLSFSADTDMAECLVIAKKVRGDSRRGTFVVLNERPAYPMLGASTAEQIRRLVSDGNLRRLEDGPMGGTPLQFGDDIIGYVLDAPLPLSSEWNLARIADLSLAQTAYQLAQRSKIWLPGMTESNAVDIPITTVDQIGEIGPYHSDVSGSTSSGGIRGPFDIKPLRGDSVPTYPVLWAHEAERERTMVFDGDKQGIPRRGRTKAEQTAADLKLAAISKTASHSHFNRDFRFNSQSTGMQFTPRKTIGGRAWLSISLSSPELEKILVLWANTSLGMLLYWWHANKQQSGRGSIGKSALQTLPVLDVTKLRTRQLEAAVTIFDHMTKRELRPLHEIDIDDGRREIDELFAVKVLGLSKEFTARQGLLELLRLKLSREPSIRGAK